MIGRATRERLPALLALVFALVLLGLPSQAAAITLPPNFSDEEVATLTQPTAIDFTPDGRMLIPSRTGPLRVYKNGALLPTAAIDLTAVTCANSERGLLGVTVDPAFSSNHFVYVYYTFKKFGTCNTSTSDVPVNRVSRFVLGDNDIIAPSSEMVLIDNIPSYAGNHNGGDVDFGKDNLLYASVGDGGCDYRGDSGCAGLNDAGRDRGALVGKILRVTRDGAIPAGNPYQGTDSDRCNVTGGTTTTRKCQEIYAWGLRNPFRFAFDQNAASTLFHINDVGQNTWEEIDVGQNNADYGWNVREGFCARDSTTNCGPPPVGMTNPIFSYGRSAGCVSVTLSAFAGIGHWPAEYDGSYLFGDQVCGRIWRLVPQGGGTYTSVEFASGISNLIDGAWGPNGTGEALYYITWAGTGNQVRRITFTGQANRAPTARINASPTAGNLPLNVTFNGSASTDPDNDPLTYEWNFGDGSPTATGEQVSHTYTTQCTCNATLTVRDGRGGQNTASVRIDAGNNPPAPTISVPTATQRFRVGEQITMTGSATDPEDGLLANSALSWKVDRHHSDHAHPYVPPTQGNNVPVTGPPPEDLLATTNSFLRIYLTATDSRGLATTVTRDFNPRLVQVTFDTNPSGFDLDVAGTTLSTPQTITSWDSWGMQVDAPDQNDSDGVPWRFHSWSDGGARAHTIVTPSTAAGYIATYVKLEYPRPGGATPLRVPLVPAFRQCTSPNSNHVAPLSNPSCTGLALESTLLTTSTTGVGGGFARWNVIAGDPDTPADEADLTITASATDVRRASNGTDYTGRVILTSNMRITDKANGSSGLVPATVSDLELSAPIQCAATPASSVGASCTITTTADTLVPGLAKEGKRAVMSAFGLVLEDVGPDGSVTPPSGACPPTCGSGDEKPFLRQGVFAP